jgi:hypothetical protein
MYLSQITCAQHRLHWTRAGVAHTFGESAPTADSASGGFVRQVPHLPGNASR